MPDQQRVNSVITLIKVSPARRESISVIGWSLITCRRILMIIKKLKKDHDSLKIIKDNLIKTLHSYRN